MRFAFFAGLLLFSFSAQAFVFVHSCPGPKKSVSLVEHEAEYRFGNKLFSPAGTSDAILKSFFQRLKTINPSRASVYPDWLAKIQATMDFRSGVVFPAGGPEVDAELNHGCELKMLVYRRAVSIAGQKQYVVDKDLWLALSPLSQATAMLELVVLHEKNSLDGWSYSLGSRPRSRFLASFLASDRIPSISLKDYFLGLKEFWLYDFDYRGIPFAGKEDLGFSDPDTPASSELNEARIVRPKEAVVTWQGGIYRLDMTSGYKGICNDGEVLFAKFLPNPNRLTLTLDSAQFDFVGVTSAYRSWCNLAFDSFDAESIVPKDFPKLTCKTLKIRSNQFTCSSATGEVEFNGIQIKNVQKLIAKPTGEIEDAYGESDLNGYRGFTGKCLGSFLPKVLKCDRASGTFKKSTGQTLTVSRSISIFPTDVIIDGVSRGMP